MGSAQNNRAGFDEQHMGQQLPPLPGAGGYYKTPRSPLPHAASRAEEFENFKKYKGAEIYRILGDNKSMSKKEKRALILL